MNVSIIDDDLRAANKLWLKLKRNWFSYKIFTNYSHFINTNFYDSDLYIIDINLQDGSWVDIVKYIRNKKNSNTPIVMYSAYDDEELKVECFDLGADDYLVKPAMPDEFVARIKSLIRRTYLNSNKKIINYDIFTYNPESRVFYVSWKRLDLTFNELNLVELFMLNI